MSKETDGIVGSILSKALSPEEQAMRDKRDNYRKKALASDDAVFDLERGLFMIHGRHPTLAGVESVIALDMPSLLSMLHGVIPTVIIPMFVAFAKQNPPSKTG